MAKRKISIKRFTIIYILLMLPLVILLWYKPVADSFRFNAYYSNTITFLTAKTMELLGVYVRYSGSLIRAGSVGLDVQFGCNGLEAVMIYVIAVISFPGKTIKKIIGIVAGFFVIQVLNLLRIMGLVYTAMHFQKVFEIMHLYVAQGIMIAVALGIFIFYLKYINTQDEDGQTAG